MILIILSIIVLVATALFSYAVLRLVTPSELKVRLEQVQTKTFEFEKAASNRLNDATLAIAKPFANLSLPEDGWENSEVRKRFMHAGYRLYSMPIYFFAAKTILAIIFPLIIYTLISVGWLDVKFEQSFFYLTLLAAIGYLLPTLMLSYKIGIRQRELFENFPDAIDLMTVCVEAGLGMDAAITKVSEEIRLKSLILAEELYLVNLELRAGRSREQALRNLALRTGIEEIEGLVAMLIQTDRFGTSIADALRVHSDMLRTKRRLRAEEAAAKIALKLLFPLIFCIFPATFLVAIGPAAIQLYRVLLPALGGN